MTIHQYQLSKNDDDEPLAKKHSCKDGFEGCATKRRSTDCLFLIIIVLLWAAMSYVGYRAITMGNPYRLISPINDQGQVCGQTDAVKNEPYFTSVMTLGVGVCAASCESYNANFTSVSPNDYYCLKYVYDYAPTDTLLSAYITVNCFDSGKFNIESNCGCMLKLETTDVFHRCQFVDPDYRDVIATQHFKGLLVNFIGDVWEVKHLIFGYAVGLSILLGFFWITILRFEWLSTIIVWSSVFGVLALLLIMCALAYTQAKEWKEEDPRVHGNREITGLRVVSAILLGLAVIWAILTCIWRKSVQLALKIMALTAECIEDMPLIVFTPVVQILAMACFVAPWIIYCFYIASTGDLIPKEYVTSLGITLTYTSYKLDDKAVNTLWFLFFCYLWTMEFITAMGQLIMAIAVSKWYFSKPDERTLFKGSSALTAAYGVALRFHAGTAAFGSLIVATIEFIRAVLLYIEKHTKGLETNPVGKFVFCCINCCLLCLEKIVRFITKNAYIQTAIHGSSFCIAAKDGFFMMCRNILRVGALHVCSTIAMVIGKIFIVVVAGATCYYIFSTRYQDQLNGTIAPTLLAMLIAWSIACMFTDVFAVAVATTLQCYITDEEFHDGNAIYATNSMKAFVNEHTMTQEEFDRKNPRVKQEKTVDDKGKFESVENNDKDKSVELVANSGANAV